MDGHPADTVGPVHEITARSGMEAPLDEQRLVELLAGDAGVPPRSRPWVTTNMVMSLDGAYAVDGRSRALGSNADHELFLAQRSLADAILVGAGTARAERYRRPSVSGPAAARRAARGQQPLPLLVVVSGSGHIPVDQPFLQGDGPTPLLVHPAGTDLSGLPAGIDPLECGTGTVDLRRLLAELRDRGVRWLNCEGGPGLLGQLAESELIDEYMLTLAPRLVGGDQVGLLGGAAASQRFTLHRLLRGGDHLLLDYRRV